MCKNTKLEEEKKESSSHGAAAAAVKTSTTTDDSASSVAHHVYFKSDDHGWVPARVRSSDKTKKQAIVVVDQYEGEQDMLQCAATAGEGTSREVTLDLSKYPNGVLPLQNTTHSGELVQYEDMVDMPYLHEAAILYNLKLRHIDCKPYTRSGDVIIATNPYQWYPDLYQREEQHHYADKLLWNDISTAIMHESELHAPKDITPHVYEVATLAYKGMALWNHPQSILVSGESGAGKTETVKICMDHIANLQRGPNPDIFEAPTRVVERILEANPLLEAFGNAQTRRNDNSSRFGRYMCLQFDRQNALKASEPGSSLSPAKLAGGVCEVYLLEKNRVVSHDASAERTYHIFYQLLAAPKKQQTKIWKGLLGKTADSFSYVGASKTNAIEGKSDSQHFDLTLDALEVVGIVGDAMTNLFRSLCVVLQLGNIVFAPDPKDDDKSIISSKQDLDHLCSLLGLPKEEVGIALTERTVVAGGDVYQVPLTAAAAKESCDGLAKDIYEKVFWWLVRSLNQATCAASDLDQSKLGKIAMLDIFGFEAFAVNRFEQLCINYANEKLQAKFTEDCFKVVQAEYKAEGIDLENIYYDDNTDVLDLIEGKTGLLAMLNEECWRPKGNAATFVNKALHQNKSSPCLIVNNTDRLGFGIHHYAGKVMYNSNDFVTRNQDRLPLGLKECAAKCANPIISQQYKSEGQGATSSNLMSKTVWTKYKSQLSTLMADLRTTESRYIRCIKPNIHKKPLVCEHNVTIDQLRSCGIVASVTIARSAFPNRMENKHVVARFGGIWHKGKKPGKAPRKSLPGEEDWEKWQAEAEALMSLALKGRKYTDSMTGKTGPVFAVGNTKTFFREGALEYLEAERLIGLDEQATIIQKGFRAYLRKKKAIEEAREFRRRLLEHRRMAMSRRDRMQHERKVRQEAEAKEEEEFEQRMAEEWAKLQARLDEEDRKWAKKLDKIDAKRQEKLDAETKKWEQKMDREDREFEARMAEDRSQWTCVHDAELAALQAEITTLHQHMDMMDLECGEKVEIFDLRRRAALEKKREIDVKKYRQEVSQAKEQQEVERKMVFCKVVLEEREKQIKLMHREKKRLEKALVKGEQKKKDLLEMNKKISAKCKDVGANYENTRRMSMSMRMEIDARMIQYEAAKTENAELHEAIAREQEKFTKVTLCKLEIKQALSKIAEIVQRECPDRKLENAVIHEIILAREVARDQRQVVEELMALAGHEDNVSEHSLSDLHESFMNLTG